MRGMVQRIADGRGHVKVCVTFIVTFQVSPTSNIDYPTKEPPHPALSGYGGENLAKFAALGGALRLGVGGGTLAFPPAVPGFKRLRMILIVNLLRKTWALPSSDFSNMPDTTPCR